MKITYPTGKTVEFKELPVGSYFKIPVSGEPDVYVKLNESPLKNCLKVCGDYARTDIVGEIVDVIQLKLDELVVGYYNENK